MAAVPQPRRRFPRPWPRTDRVESTLRAVDDFLEPRFTTPPSPALDRFFYGLSSAADHSLIWHALGALRAARTGEPKIAVRLSIVLGIESALTNGPVKSRFKRVRPPSQPEGPLPYGMRRPITSSFPSGHATAAFTAATMLSQGSPAAAPAYFALAGIVAYSRVYTKMHHPSDVLVGAGLGLVFGQIGRRLLPLS
ncbi:MAG: rane-associated phospholipid phosphatase [Actinomycetia bacterium]|nr:rane-associated phospholipid phosphatase [Actinomycetes bacterium]